jgi:hypothetical protein
LIASAARTIFTMKFLPLVDGVQVFEGTVPWKTLEVQMFVGVGDWGLGAGGWKLGAGS